MSVLVALPVKAQEKPLMGRRMRAYIDRRQATGMIWMLFDHRNPA